MSWNRDFIFYFWYLLNNETVSATTRYYPQSKTHKKCLNKYDKDIIVSDDKNILSYNAILIQCKTQYKIYGGLGVVVVDISHL